MVDSTVGNLVMVRHGESMGNVWSGSYYDDRYNFLSLKGMKQAELAGIELERTGFQFDYIITSELTRSRQTAVIIMQVMNDWQRQYHPVGLFNEYQWIPNDTLSEHAKRVAEGMSAYVEPVLSKGNVLCVTHHYTMQAMFDYLSINRSSLLAGGEVCPNGVPFFYHIGRPGEISAYHEWEWKKQG